MHGETVKLNVASMFTVQSQQDKNPSPHQKKIVEAEACQLKNTLSDVETLLQNFQKKHKMHVGTLFVKLSGYIRRSWPGSVVGIATAYGLDGPGIESRWRRDFPH